MRYSPKTVLATGALLVLAGSRCPAQEPADGGQKLLSLPAPAEVSPTAPKVQTNSYPVVGEQAEPPFSSPTDLRMPTNPPCPTTAALAQLGTPLAGPPSGSAAPPEALSNDGPGAIPHASCPPLLAYRTEYYFPVLGAPVYQPFQIQVNNAIAARMILHEYDFICGGPNLNLRGSDRLLQLAMYFKSHSYPLVIERTPYNVHLAEARRVVVLNRLTELGFGVPPEHVVIGAPLAIPLRGIEAEIIFRNLLQQTETRGYGQGAGPGQAGVLNNGTAGALPPR